MHNDEFLIKLERNIQESSLEDIKLLFEQTHLIKNQTSVQKYYKKVENFFKLGYQPRLSNEALSFKDLKKVNIKSKLFELVVKNNRLDVLDFMLEKKYLNEYDIFYNDSNSLIYKSIDSVDALSYLIIKYKNKVEKNHISVLMGKFILHDLDKSVDALFKLITDISKETTQKEMYEFVYSAIEKHANKVVKKLLDKDFPYYYDVTYMENRRTKDQSITFVSDRTPTDTPRTFLSYSAKYENYEIFKFLLSSHRLKFYADIEDNFRLLKILPNFVEIMTLVPKTSKIEKLIENNNLTKEYNSISLKGKLENKLDKKFKEKSKKI